MKPFITLMPILASMAKKGQLAKGLSAIVTLGSIIEPMLADPNEFAKLMAFLESFQSTSAK